MLRISKYLAVIAALCLVAPAAAWAAGPRIAFVDLQSALTSVKEGKKIKAQLEKLMKKKKEELETEQDELRALKDELEKQAPMMKEEVRRKKLMEFQDRVAAFQEAYLSSQKMLADKEQELTKPMIATMVQIAEEIAKDRGFDMVLERATVVYGQSDMDLTDELIKRYNARHK